VWADDRGLTFSLSYSGRDADCCRRHSHVPVIQCTV